MGTTERRCSLPTTYISQAWSRGISSFDQLACSHMRYDRTYPRKGKEVVLCISTQGKSHNSYSMLNWTHKGDRPSASDLIYWISYNHLHAHSPLTTHHSPLTTHHSPLTTHSYSPSCTLTTHSLLNWVDKDD